MFICPVCGVKLKRTAGSPGVFWSCPACGGRGATVSLLRKKVPRDVVNALWQAARGNTWPRTRRCPACDKPMAEVPASATGTSPFVDVCTVCQFVWFDPREYEALPLNPREVTFERQLPAEARERLALAQLEAIRERARDSDWGAHRPDVWWQWIPGLLGMPIEDQSEALHRTPWVTWLLALVVSAVSIAAFFDLETVVRSFALVPDNFGRHAGLTLLTSFFLHGSVFHLVSNMYFFLVFGDNVEDWLGTGRYLLLLLCATLAGHALHIIADPGSATPCIGASGGISGIIAFYALKFPRARLGLLIRISLWFRWIRMPAYGMFLVWIALQLLGAWTQLAGLGNVSFLAHLGGAAVGVVFWLVTR